MLQQRSALRNSSFLPESASGGPGSRTLASKGEPESPCFRMMKTRACEGFCQTKTLLAERGPSKAVGGGFSGVRAAPAHGATSVARASNPWKGRDGTADESWRGRRNLGTGPDAAADP